MRQGLFPLHGIQKDVDRFFFSTVGNNDLGFGDSVIVAGKNFHEQLAVGGDFQILGRFGDLYYGRFVGNNGEDEFFMFHGITLREIGILQGKTSGPILAEHSVEFEKTFVIAS